LRIQNLFILTIVFKRGLQDRYCCAASKKRVCRKHGVPFTSEFSPSEVDLNDYDAVIIPGGQALTVLRIHPDLVQLVKEANSKGKVIAAVCHGPQMLIEADIVRGKTTTSWPSVRTDLKNAGANVVDEPAVVMEIL